MKLDDPDDDQSYYPPPRKGVDKSIGYMLMGMVVVLFFSLFLMGMNRVQNVSSQVVNGHSRTIDEVTPSDIGDTSDAAKN
jgi:hypothetical protein